MRTVRTVGFVINVYPSRNIPLRVGVVSLKTSQVTAIKTIPEPLSYIYEILHRNLIKLLDIEYTPNPGAATPRYYLLLLIEHDQEQPMPEDTVIILGVRIARESVNKYTIVGLTKWGIEVTYGGTVKLHGYWSRRATIELLRALSYL